MDGLGVLALLWWASACCWWRLRRRPWSQADLLLAGSLLVPLALYSFYSTGEVRLRHFSLALPWVMLAAALGLDLAGGIVRSPSALRSLWPAALWPAARRRRSRASSRWTRAPIGMPAVPGRPRRPARRRAPTDQCWRSSSAKTAPTPACAKRSSTCRPICRRWRREYPTLVVDMQAYVFPGELTDDATRSATPRSCAPQRQRRLVSGRPARALRQHLGRLERPARPLAGQQGRRQPVARLRPARPDAIA